MNGSLRRRLVIPVAVISALGMAVMAVVLYVVTRRSASDQRDQALASRAHALAAIAEREEGDYEMVLPPQPAGEPVSYAEVWRPDGSVLLRSTSLGTADLPRGFARVAGIAYDGIELPDHRRGRAVALRFEPRDESGAHSPPLLLVLAEGDEPIDATLATLRHLFLAIGLGSVLVIAGVTAWVIARGTRPLARLAAEIAAIDDRQLGARLAHDDLPAELLAPVRKLDDLLARLEVSFARERQLTADVSHELRTPLAGLRTLLEVVALGDRTPQDYRAALADALAVVLQMSAMVENLLALARLEAGQVAVTEDACRLHDLVAQCWAPQVTVAAKRGVEFRNHVDPATSVRTDPDKLRIVVTNLLANAAEYTEPGGWIEVTHGEHVLAVTDSGPALSVEELERVFDRMWRGDRARSGNGAHCGIGLALSRSVCTRLSLTLTAASGPDGRVSFRISRPAR